MLVAVGPADLPLIVGIPHDCTHLACGVPYWGPMQADAMTHFVADTLLNLPSVTPASLSSQW